MFLFVKQNYLHNLKCVNQWWVEWMDEWRLPTHTCFKSNYDNDTQNNIAANTNPQSSLSNNILDCFTAGCVTGYDRLPHIFQPNVFLLLTEGLWQMSTFCGRNLCPTETQRLPNQTHFWSLTCPVFSLCVSLCHCSCNFHNSLYSDRIPSYRGLNIGVSPGAEAEFQSRHTFQTKHFYCPCALWLWPWPSSCHTTYQTSHLKEIYLFH